MVTPRVMPVVGATLVSSLLLLGLLCHAASRKLTRRQPMDRVTSPEEYGLDYEPVIFLGKDGVTLRGWLIPCRSARGTIIFCQGHSGSMDADLHYAPAFHARGYHVLLFDFRGHGRSGGDHITLGYLERWDLLAAVEMLEKRGMGPVGLLGFSMGGAIAMLTAPFSSTIRAVVSDGGYAYLESILSGWLIKKRLPAFLAKILGKISVWATSRRIGCDSGQLDPIHLADQIAPAGLFLIHGERDIFVPVEHVMELYQRAGSRKKIWIHPGARHREVDCLAHDHYLPAILDFFDTFFPSRA